MPGIRGRYWNCFSCGAKGDILVAASYKEGLVGFYNSTKFLSSKYNIKIETEDPETSTKRDFQTKQILNYQKETTGNYYYEDELGNILYKICRRKRMDKSERKKDFMAYTKDNRTSRFKLKEDIVDWVK